MYYVSFVILTPNNNKNTYTLVVANFLTLIESESESDW
jgi:hypothetical protein